MSNGTWTDPAIHTNYGTLRQSILAKAGRPGGIDINQADLVDRRWRSIGKRIAAGRY